MIDECFLSDGYRKRVSTYLLADVGDALGWVGSVGNMKLDAGIGYFNLYPMSKYGKKGNDVYETYAELTPEQGWSLGNFGSLTPFAKVEVIHSTYKGIPWTVIPRAGARHSVTIGKWTLNEQADFGHYPKILDTKAGNVFAYEGGLNYRVDKNWSFGPTIRVVRPTGFGGERRKETIIGLGAQFNF